MEFKYSFFWVFLGEEKGGREVRPYMYIEPLIS